MTAKTELEALWNRALLLHRDGKPAEAEPLYVRILAANPALAQGWNLLGVARAQQNRAADALAAFDRALALQPDLAESLSHRAATLWALGRFAEAVPAYDKALARSPANAPATAEAWNYRGGALAMLGRAEEALESFSRAVAARPGFIEALNNRGVTEQGLKRFDESLKSFDAALALQPSAAEVLNNRGVSLSEMGRFDEALAAIEKALALKPGYAEGHYNHGGVLADLGRYGDALASYDRAIGLNPDYAEGHYNKSLLLLLLGQMDIGFRQYEWRKRRHMPMTTRNHPQPHWLGAEDISGKTLLVYWEQGLGDTIQFCRYAPAAAKNGAKVILSVQKPLLRLLRQLPDIEVIGEQDTPAQFDYQTSLLSLPLALGGIPAAPYLKADPQLTAEWAQRLPPKTNPRIGLVWRGGADHRNDHNRSLALESLLPLLGEQADWFCLQKEMRADDQAAFARHGGIHVFGPENADFADTAAQIALMDLVISVDTSVAHLAGAMGVPVWILLSWRPDWRWQLTRNDTPWYSGARLFRQPQRGDWASVVEDLKAALG